jgi:molybdopterin-guanine dinucleotide biosynthesis protein A
VVDLSAIVLAGGKSSRMGRDKALICIHGVPLLQKICQIARSCSKHVYIVTPWPERYQYLDLSGCEFILETPLNSAIDSQKPLAGPIVGFAQGLKHVKTDWVLLLACDLPNLKLAVFTDWIEQLETVEAEAIACLVHQVHGWEPLCGFYRRSCLTLLVDFIHQGGTSFQDWLGNHQVAVLPLTELDMLFNCNTPEDLSNVGLPSSTQPTVPKPRAVLGDQCQIQSSITKSNG